MDVERRLVCGGLLGYGVLALAPACSRVPVADSPQRPELSQGLPVSFAFSSSSGDRFESKTTLGRATLVLFVTTFDMASQIMVRRVQELTRSFTPRINAGAVVMEAARYEVLVRTFKEELKLTFPVVIGDHSTLQGRGPFGVIQHIPTLVVLDRSGREVARFAGPVALATIEQALTRALGR